MEMENRYASKGVGGTALGLAIGALGVEAMRGGFNGILGGGGGCCNEDHVVNRYELSMQQELAAKDSKIAFLPHSRRPDFDNRRRRCKGK